MVDSLWTGISGLASHQKALDNESHNIANVNTIGYKSSRISFSDQMYQDKIGKGSKVLDSEKLYTQGNIKLTGVAYDVALNGDGFFYVRNSRFNGVSENLYTRAGNFRMGDNGTLQDPARNEVQGWMMRTIDTKKDITTTNPNVHKFTNDYTKVISSKIIRHSNYIETITAKATDYTKTAKGDLQSAFNGAGMKSKASKISDVEEAIKDYTNWLQKLKDEPDEASESSISQISQINFKSGNNALISKTGDQIYAYIDGNKYSQNFISKIADDELISNLVNKDTDTNALLRESSQKLNLTTAIDNTRYEIKLNKETFYYDSGLNTTKQEILEGLKNKIESNSSFSPKIIGDSLVFGSNMHLDKVASYKSIIDISYDLAASRIETYKAFANKISEIPGIIATTIKESDGLGGNNDVLQANETFRLSTSPKDILKGMIEIKSLIPGKSFSISEIGEVSNSSTLQGTILTQTQAKEGSGIGALESSREALSKLLLPY